jgi:hypothetical protein
MTMSKTPDDTRTQRLTLDDGTLEVRTTDADPYYAESRAREDAEVQAALDALRAQGICRPVLFHIEDNGEMAATKWQRLLPALQAHGISVFSTAPTGVAFVLRPDRSRDILQPVFGRDAARLFRTAEWPVSYFTVAVGSNSTQSFESRTFKDMERDNRP